MNHKFIVIYYIIHINTLCINKKNSGNQNWCLYTDFEYEFKFMTRFP